MPCGIRRSSYLGSPTRFFLLLASVLPFVPWTSLVITRFSLKFARTKHLEVSEWKKQEGGIEKERSIRRRKSEEEGERDWTKGKKRGEEEKQMSEGEGKRRVKEGRREREREYSGGKEMRRKMEENRSFFFFFWANSFLARIHTVNRVKAKLAWVKWNTLLLSRDVVAKLVNRIHKGEWGGLINVGLSGDR